MKSLCDTYYNLLKDFKRLLPDVCGLDRDFVTIQQRVKHEGISFLTITLTSLGKSFDLSLSEGSWTRHTSFSSSGMSTLPKFLSGLLSRVFDDGTGLLLDNPSVECIKIIRELCYLCRKLTLTETQDANLDISAKRGFFETEQQISEDLDSDQLRFYRSVCAQVVGRLDSFSTLKYRHGPGSVSERATSNQKWFHVVRGFVDHDPSLDYFVEPDLFRYGITKDIERPDTAPSSVARLISVVKNSSSRRTITIEPLLNQYFQQGLSDHLRTFIRRDRILRNSLSLTDQSKNQHLARIGSRDGSYATLDLSSASDLLANWLVKATFESCPKFLRAIQDSRTNRVDLSTSDLLKFAGMGNALTFPVQSVVFTLICVSAMLFGQTTCLSRKELMRATRRVRVYGDDIIVPTDAYHQVVSWLSMFGLKVNQTKSFHRGNFRESCGLDAYRGYDVTPLYLKAQPQLTSHSTKAINSLVAFSNLCWKRGLYSTATYVANRVESLLNYKLPLGRSGCGYLSWENRREASSFSKWNDKLHRFEVKTYTTKAKMFLDPIDGYPALVKSLSVPLVGRAPKHLERSARRYSIYHCQRWVRAV